jgi:hypothetical protein
MSEDSEYRPGRESPTLAPPSAVERARDTGRVWQRHATMASEERLRDPRGSPRSAPGVAHSGGSEGADSTPVASAISDLTLLAIRHYCWVPVDCRFWGNLGGPRRSGLTVVVSLVGSPVVDDETDIVVRAQYDHRAFAHLYRQYLPQIYRYCYRRLGSQETAEGATSRIFTQALAR